MAPSSPIPLSDRPNPNEASQPRACASCSRAKVKCVSGQENGAKCERCQRLKKICAPSTPQDRHPRKRRPKTTTHVPKSHVEKLEQKLDGLVSLIKSTQDTKSTQEIASQGRLLSTLSPLSPSTSSHLATPGAAYVCESNNVSLSTAIPSFAEANELLNFFRDQIAPQFPFIVIPQSVSAEKLHAERPFLYISILAISSRDCAQQRGLGRIVMKQLAEKMFVNCEKSLDLLLGVLTYIAWCYYHFCTNSPLTSLLSAAMSLIFDLGLTRGVPKTAPKKFSWEEALREICPGPKPHYQAVRTAEQQRAVLGYYFICSMTVTFSRRMDPFHTYSVYTGECLKAIEEFGDSQNDKSAVALVRLQTVLERVHQCSWHSKTEPKEINSSTMLIVSAIQQELRQLRENLHLEQANDATSLLHYHLTEISLYEAGLCKPLSTTDDLPGSKRLELLCACLQASKSYFDVFLSIPVATYPTMSMVTWSHLTYCLTNLLALSHFEHPEWNLLLVRETIDFSVLSSQLIERLDAVTSLPGYGKLDLFSRTAKRAGRIMAFFASSASGQPQGTVNSDSDQLPNSTPAPGSEDLSQFFQFLDDTWMGDMGPLDYQSNIAP